MKVYYKTPDVHKQTFYFAGDIHYGIKSSDINAFVKEMEEAKARDARIILIGDIFDAIFPHGDKRWNPTLLIPELRERDDAPMHAIALMSSILEPFAGNIDLIGMGNHEAAVLKYLGIDMIRILTMTLNHKLDNESKILYGGYTGYLGYRFKAKSSNGVKIFKILYHHGSGGSSAVTKGITDVNRKASNWNYDLFVFGHKHHCWAVRDVTISPVFRKDNHGFLVSTDNRAVQTGAFYRNYPESLNSDLPTYEEIKQHAPKPIGGVFVNVELQRQRIPGLKTDSLAFKVRCEI